MAQEQLREKLMARVSDRPLVDLVLSTAPNKLTSKGAVFRHCPSATTSCSFAWLPDCIPGLNRHLSCSRCSVSLLVGG